MDNPRGIEDLIDPATDAKLRSLQLKRVSAYCSVVYISLLGAEKRHFINLTANQPAKWAEAQFAQIQIIIS